MKTIKSFFSKILNFFRSGAAERVFDEAAGMVPIAVEIVKTIAALTPNRTDDEIARAFAAYGVPAVQDLKQTPADQRGYLLLDLATKALAQQFPGVKMNILNAAVQVAVTGLKAK